MVFRRPILTVTLGLCPFLFSSAVIAQTTWECAIEKAFLCGNKACEQIVVNVTSYLFLTNFSEAEAPGYNIGRCDEDKQICWGYAGEVYTRGGYYTLDMKSLGLALLDEDETNSSGLDVENFGLGGSYLLAKMSLDGSEYIETLTAGAEVLVSQGSCHQTGPAQPQE